MELVSGCKENFVNYVMKKKWIPDVWLYPDNPIEFMKQWFINLVLYDQDPV